jgi:hypothetical protein
MDLFESSLSDERTSYSIRDEFGERSSITLPKFIADILQIEVPSVHDWTQRSYDRVAAQYTHLSRRMKGNIVREWAIRFVFRTKTYHVFAEEFLTRI